MYEMGRVPEFYERKVMYYASGTPRKNTTSRKLIVAILWRLWFAFAVSALKNWYLFNTPSFTYGPSLLKSLAK